MKKRLVSPERIVVLIAFITVLVLLAYFGLLPSTRTVGGHVAHLGL